MRSKQRLGQASRFEQSEAQQHRIAHAGPDGGGHIPANADILHQHGIDVHAHHDEKRLESQSKCVNHVVAQSEIILLLTGESVLRKPSGTPQSCAHRLGSKVNPLRPISCS